MTEDTDQPEVREFWVIDHMGVRVTKEQCIRSLIRPNHWFCPRYNFTSIQGSKLFDTREMALEVLRRDMSLHLQKARLDYEKALAIAD